MKGPLKQDDSDLINLIRRKLLVPPPDNEVPYNLHHDKKYERIFPSWILINSILQDFYPPDNQGGFFVEAGALDGEFLSNTLRLEMEQGWTGLLVEPDKDNFQFLLDTNRKAWLSPTCLSIHNYPESVVLQKLREVGREVDWLMRAGAFIVTKDDVIGKEKDPHFLTAYQQSQCLPTQSLLMAINVSHVDFFSLDIELVEESILDHFPFDQITVDIWAIEHRREGISQKIENKTLQNYSLADLKRLGYNEDVIRYRERLINEFEDQRFIKVMIDRGYYYFDMSCAFVGDYIFIRKTSDLYKKLNVPAHYENRTEICKDKEIHATAKMSYTVDRLRDRHHYPKLKYQE